MLSCPILQTQSEKLETNQEAPNDIQFLKLQLKEVETSYFSILVQSSVRGKHKSAF